MRVATGAFRVFAIVGLLAAFPIPLLAQSPGGASPSISDAMAADVTAIREATERYRDVAAALADGYIPDPTNTCVTASMVGLPAVDGQMGIHYFHPGLLGVTGMQPRVTGADATLDWTRPEVLLYEPQPDGTLELLGVEYLVFESAWRAAGKADAPSFHGAAFTRMADDPATEIDEAHMFEPHYELHLWTIRENPTGITAEFNPAVRCPAATPDEADPHAAHGGVSGR